MRLEDFDYELPPERIAQAPAQKRDGSRLLVHRRADGSHEHTAFHELPRLLPEGSLLVLNDTRVVPARLRARKPTGGAVELLILLGDAAPPGAYRCLARSSKPLRPGTRLSLLSTASPEDVEVEILEREGERATIRIHGSLGERGLLGLLEQHGEVPLPPYIVREGAPGAVDAERYQTVYAKQPGAVAAPTAGLHFSPELLAALRSSGHELATLTLHVGPGTFAPIRAENLLMHEMHAERYELPEATCAAVRRAKLAGRPVVAVGTTVVRALEQAARGAGGAAKLSAVTDGTTRLFVYPGFRFEVVDALVTNFHLPRSTLLLLVAALTGREKLLALYAEALTAGYRFYSYGDAMLVLP
jgi:S-adenosylmethionine:tRNA ribosyltransferase-isomerase